MNRAPPLAYDSLIFALTLYKFFVSLRMEGWTHVIVIRKFMRDGVWAFALPTGAFGRTFSKHPNTYADMGGERRSGALHESRAQHCWRRIHWLGQLVSSTSDLL